MTTKQKQAAREADRRKADAAWDKYMAKAALPFGSPKRLTYPAAARKALQAWDAIMNPDLVAE